MQHRNITKDKILTSVLGFGLMRLPVIDGDNCVIDKVSSMEMLKFAYDNGVNYFDTAYIYHCEKSETILGEFLKTIDRSSVHVATKLPMWLCETYEDYQKMFDIQLERLQTDYIDFYLTHSLSKKSFDKMCELDVFNFLDQKKSTGEIKYAGFSFHDELSVFKEILDSYDWDFCQIQLNYLDANYQAGVEGLRLAREKGISVIIMEPMKGGSLVDLPEESKVFFEENNVTCTPAELAQKWVYDHDISLLLSGMSNMDQTIENIRIANSVSDKNLKPNEEKAVEQIVKFLNDRIKVGCTSCEYCMPCPFGVNIPGVFERYNHASVFNKYESSKKSYAKLISDEKDATRCTECGTCESLCPQSIEIIDKLKEADAALTD